jgi:hypothetical protein
VARYGYTSHNCTLESLWWQRRRAKMLGVARSGGFYVLPSSGRQFSGGWTAYQTSNLIYSTDTGHSAGLLNAMRRMAREATAGGGIGGAQSDRCVYPLTLTCAESTCMLVCIIEFAGRSLSENAIALTGSGSRREIGAQAAFGTDIYVGVQRWSGRGDTSAIKTAPPFYGLAHTAYTTAFGIGSGRAARRQTGTSRHGRL